MDDFENLSCNSQIFRRVSDRRSCNEFFRTLYRPANDDARAIKLLAELLTPLFQYLADGYKWGNLDIRAFLVLYALRPDLVNGESMTEAGKRFGVKRQSVQHLLNVLKETVPSLEIDSESRRGREGDRSLSVERGRRLRDNGKALKLTRFARQRKRIAA